MRNIGRACYFLYLCTGRSSGRPKVGNDVIHRRQHTPHNDMIPLPSHSPLPTAEHPLLPGRRPCLYIILAALGLLLPALFGACVPDNAPSADSERLTAVKLRLSVSAMPTRSEESSPSDETGVGDSGGDIIDCNDLWVAAFNLSDGRRVDSGVAVPTDAGNEVSLRFNEDIVGGDGVMIVALANWSRWGVTASTFESVSDLDGLYSLTFELPPFNAVSEPDASSSIPTALPMYGSTVIPVASGDTEVSDTAVSGSSSGLEVHHISMSRALAKIEITDNIGEETSVESASLVKYRKGGHIFPCQREGSYGETGYGDVDYGDNLEFMKASDGSLYVYLPETELGPVNSDLRKITITLSDGSTSSLTLTDYRDNKPSDTPSEDWQTLRPNTIYRFNITGLIQTTPEIEIQPTLRICWNHADAGLYKANRITLFKDDNDEEGFILNDNEKCVATDQTISFDGNRNCFSTNYYDVKMTDDLTFQKLNYVIFYGNYSYKYVYTKDKHFHLVRNLKKDTRHLMNVGEITYCWITPLSLYDIMKWNDPSAQIFYLPLDGNYRFYWRFIEDPNFSNELIFTAKDATFSKEVQKFDPEKQYYYLDFSITGEKLREFDYSYSNPDYNSGNALTGTIDLVNLLVEEIDGEEYYVFYAN